MFEEVLSTLCLKAFSGSSSSSAASSSPWCVRPFAVVRACLPDLTQDVLSIDEGVAVADVVHHHEAVGPVDRLLQDAPGLRALPTTTCSQVTLTRETPGNILYQTRSQRTSTFYYLVIVALIIRMHTCHKVCIDMRTSVSVNVKYL